MIKLVPANLSHHIAQIFNLSVDKCSFPDEAKLAEVVPAFKKDDNLSIKNYRPISILSTSSKILERLMLIQLTPFLNEILSPIISAYRRGYCCETVLVKLIEDGKMMLDKSKFVGNAMIDLSKAFDSLPHQLIVAKMRAYGASYEACGLICSYLSNRRQCVRVNGTKSNWNVLSKGVPQGSIMGPALFNLFLNDIVTIFKRGRLYNYADDNSICVSASTREDVISNLEEEICQAITWFESNMMAANPTKFQVLFLKDCKELSRVRININDTEIISEENVKLLGVRFDEMLNFNSHVKDICRKAGAQLNVLQRLAKFLDYDCRRKIFDHFILSQFRYCAPVWHFCGSQNTQKLEKIQLGFVFMDFQSDYVSLLERAKLPTLETHRQRLILKLVYKSIKKLSPPILWDLFTTTVPRYNLRNRRNLVSSHCRTKSFGIRSLKEYGTMIWNNLPSHARDLDLEIGEI